jgi:hypothetical protein
MATKIVDVRAGNNGSKDLPSTHKVVHVDYTDPETGLQYGGDFTIKRMTLGDIRKSAVMRAQLNGGLPESAIEENVRFLNTILAHLSYSIVKSPDWWKPEEFYNGGVIYDLYKEVTVFEDSFRPLISKGPSSAKADSKSETGIVGAPTETMVDEEISASANG